MKYTLAKNKWGVKCDRTQHDHYRVLVEVIYSGLASGLIAAIVSLSIWFATGARERAIRADERAQARINIDDARAHEAQLREEERAYEDRVRVFEVESSRKLERDSTAREQSKKVQRTLKSLLRTWAAEGDRGTTYSYDRDWTLKIETQIALLPDAEFREYLGRAIRVLNETWVLERVGELPDSGTAVQRNHLRAISEALSQYISDNTWDRVLLVGVRSVQAEIDTAWSQYFKDMG